MKTSHFPSMPRWLIYAVLTMLLWGAWGVVSKPL